MNKTTSIFYLNKYKNLKKLMKGKKNKSGRNSKGQLILRFRGGGHKKLYKNIEYNYNNIQNEYIINLVYDPNRNTYIGLTQNLFTKQYKYRYLKDKVLPLSIFDKKSLINQKNANQNKEDTDEYNIIIQQLKNYKAGDFICHIHNFQKKNKITYVRSAGCNALILKNDVLLRNNNKFYTLIKMPSGEQRFFDSTLKAVLGSCNNKNWNLRIWKKAGLSRLRNKRPKVRGVAMNPIDHPHGGGEGKTSGGRPSVNFKGWPAKGKPKKTKNVLIYLKRITAKKLLNKNEK